MKLLKSASSGHNRCPELLPALHLPPIWEMLLLGICCSLFAPLESPGRHNAKALPALGTPAIRLGYKAEHLYKLPLRYI